MKREPTREEVLEAFDYDEAQGCLRFRRTWARSTAGQPAGGIDKQGNIIIGSNGWDYYLCEMIWFLHGGIWSKRVRHHDGNKLNNHISNLFSLPDKADLLMPQDVLNLFSYDRELGTLTRKHPYSKGLAGSTGVDVNGYLKHTILRKQIGVHILVWLIETGGWPEEEIDHINGVRTDNRVGNLRAVSRQENSRNQQRRADNSTGATGISYASDRGKYRAYIKGPEKVIKLGSYDNFEDAVRARKAAEAAYGYHPNHGLTKEERAKTA